MIRIILLCFFFISLNSFSQEIGIEISIPNKTEFTEAILRFNDGTEIEGIGRIKTVFTSREDVIVFKIEKKDEDETWTSKDVKGITIIYNDFITHYEYLKISKYSFAELYEVITEGNVTLYKKRKKDETRIGSSYPTNMTNNNGLTSDFPNSNNKIKEIPIYYFKRENEEYPTKLKDNYIKSSLTYLNDCEIVVDKIKQHKYNLSNIRKMVDDYNANCGF